jgi:uncharacterized membrane protein HdeD (DUF308 family)
MLSLWTRYWWLWLLRGVAAVLFGIVAFALPGITLAVLIIIAGAYLLVDGIFTIVAALRVRGRYERWWLTLLEGVFDVIAGALIFFWPGITALVLIWLIAAWAVATGILMILAAIRLRLEIAGEWLLGLGGVLSILLGVLLFLAPRAGLIIWVWMIGFYALFFGVLQIALALRLRRLGSETLNA